MSVQRHVELDSKSYGCWPLCSASFSVCRRCVSKSSVVCLIGLSGCIPTEFTLEWFSKIPHVLCKNQVTIAEAFAGLITYHGWIQRLNDGLESPPGLLLQISHLSTSVWSLHSSLITIGSGSVQNCPFIPLGETNAPWDLSSCVCSSLGCNSGFTSGEWGRKVRQWGWSCSMYL